METITTVHQNGTILADNLKKPDNHDTTEYAMKVENLTKNYGQHEAVKDVTFNVKLGEVSNQTRFSIENKMKICNFSKISLLLQCFGLLGANGAGKSTIFAMLSGELAPTSGKINMINGEHGIAYCPQTNPLDNLLTVQEIMSFYGQLRRIKNIHEVISLKYSQQHKQSLTWVLFFLP